MVIELKQFTDMEFKDTKKILDKISEKTGYNYTVIDDMEDGCVGYSLETDGLHTLFEYGQCGDAYCMNNKCAWTDYEERLCFQALRSLPFIEENIRPYFYDSDFYDSEF